MKRFHLIFGILALIVFILTGQFMARCLNPVGMDIAVRLLYRTRHIFLLMSSLSHILLGLYFVAANAGWRKYLQMGGSVLLTAATGLFLAGFFIESPARDLETPWSHWGTYVALAGTLFHLVTYNGQRKTAQP
jgi:uncharacterized membrane protein